MTVWILKIRGDVNRAIGSGHWCASELEYRVTRLLIRQIVRLYPNATEVRRVAVEYQLQDLLERWYKVQRARDEVEKARTSQVELPSGPRQEFQRSTKGMYHLAKSIVDELGTAYLGRMKADLDETSREVLRAVKGSAFDMEETDTEVGDAVERPKQSEAVLDATPQEATDAPTTAEAEAAVETAAPAPEATAPSVEIQEPPTETIAGLPDKIRIIKARKTEQPRQREEKRARELLERYGGQLWIDENAPLSAEDLERKLKHGADNGGPRVTRRGGRRERTTA